MASVQHKLHKLLAMHSTLPLVSACVAIPLVAKIVEPGRELLPESGDVAVFQLWKLQR
jgi:hypothetical protein